MMQTAWLARLEAMFAAPQLDVQAALSLVSEIRKGAGKRQCPRSTAVRASEALQAAVRFPAKKANITMAKRQLEALRDALKLDTMS
jgi:hypothetical protein